MLRVNEGGCRLESETTPESWTKRMSCKELSVGNYEGKKERRKQEEVINEATLHWGAGDCDLQG